MNKNIIKAILGIKLLIVTVFSIPIFFALYHIRRFGRDNPKDKPSNPFYE